MTSERSVTHRFLLPGIWHILANPIPETKAMEMRDLLRARA